VIWLWLGLGALAALVVLFLLTWLALYLHIRIKVYPYLFRIFQEKPLFIIPRGQPVEDAEEVTVPTVSGLALRGIYLRTTAPRRQGVILFGLEYGSNRWACVPYTQFLREAGFDVFTCEPRSQGDSDQEPGYEPLQWVTEHEVHDMRAALAYLRGRADADPQGVGFFGISKGGGAGLLAAADDSSVRCFVTDGIFATHTTMLPYMRKWIAIYSNRRWLQRILPDWYYLMFARKGLRTMERDRRCRFPHLENHIQRLAPRPLLMIHGGADTYIKPEMARALFEKARQPKELWLVDGAKHNQPFHVANDEYKRRVLAFFRSHLGSPAEPEHECNGIHREESRLAPLTTNQG
jgi:pimeloyl-ACP methyl ester carboxylesterase